MYSDYEILVSNVSLKYFLPFGDFPGGPVVKTVHPPQRVQV